MKKPKLTTMYRGKEVEYELCEPTPEAVRLIMGAHEAHKALMARRYTVTIENIDVQLLKKQKRTLVALQNKRPVTAIESDTIEGILNLLDTIQDRAEAQESE